MLHEKDRCHTLTSLTHINIYVYINYHELNGTQKLHTQVINVVLKPNGDWWLFISQ